MKHKELQFIDLDERGKTTEYCRALHAKMGSYIGNGARGGCQMPRHRGETSGVLIIYEESDSCDERQRCNESESQRQSE